MLSTETHIKYEDINMLKVKRQEKNTMITLIKSKQDSVKIQKPWAFLYTSMKNKKMKILNTYIAYDNTLKNLEVNSKERCVRPLFTKL